MVDYSKHTVKVSSKPCCHIQFPTNIEDDESLVNELKYAPKNLDDFNSKKEAYKFQINRLYYQFSFIYNIINDEFIFKKHIFIFTNEKDYT